MPAARALDTQMASVVPIVFGSWFILGPRMSWAGPPVAVDLLDDAVQCAGGDDHQRGVCCPVDGLFR